MHAGLDGGLLDPQDQGDLLDGELGDILENQGQSKLQRHLDQGRAETLQRLTGQGGIQRILGVGNDGYLIARGQKLLQGAHPRGFPGPPPVPTLTGAYRDGEQPTRRRRAPFELIPFAVGVQEGLLQQILCVGGVAADTQTEPVQLVSEAIEQHGDGPIGIQVNEDPVVRHELEFISLGNLSRIRVSQVVERTETQNLPAGRTQ